MAINQNRIVAFFDRATLMSFYRYYYMLYWCHTYTDINEVMHMTKTARIMNMYRIFQNSEEVEMQELFNSFGSYNKKTFMRDIALLKRIGLPIKYSKKRQAYVYVDENGKEAPHEWFRNEPVFPKRKKERQQMEMIMRLMTLVDDIPEDNCDVWYKETFPNVSKRTMQRDFAFLRKELDFEIFYMRFNDCGDENFEPYYTCEIPGWW